MTANIGYAAPLAVVIPCILGPDWPTRDEAVKTEKKT